MDNIKSDTIFDLEYFFEMAPDLLCIAGFDGYFKKINPSVSKTLGYSAQELFAVPINSFVHPDDQETTAFKRAGLTEGNSLLNFENRYLTKDGAVVWLSWTSVPIMRDKLVFAIAKNITYRKQIEEYERISHVLGMVNDDYQQRFKTDGRPYIEKLNTPNFASNNKHEEPSQSEQFWLNNFEACVRKYVGQPDLNLTLISNELALSQRQLFRRVNSILGITPNKLVRIIRLQMAWEAIASGKYRTIKEVSGIAGYNSTSHFSRLFKEVYGIHVLELLK